MVSESEVIAVLRTINDPEMPISIMDLGIIDHVSVAGAESPKAGTHIKVDVLPTFVGCAALPMIESMIRQKLIQLPGVTSVEVNFKYSPAWTVDRISAAGREALRHFGVTVPHVQSGLDNETPAEKLTCPFCGSENIELESSFGPTRCRMIYHCLRCKNPFEHLKRLNLPVL
jgi:ring-1,2-phenylacetyl-CoA epoxidase subunit PaaD